MVNKYEMLLKAVHIYAFHTKNIQTNANIIDLPKVIIIT